MKTLAKIETAKGKLIYTLFSTETDEAVTYGITVNSKLFGEETASLQDISTDFDFTEKLMLMLAENFVLPSTFKEVAEEYIAAAATV